MRSYGSMASLQLTFELRFSRHSWSQDAEPGFDGKACQIYFALVNIGNIM